MQRKASARWQGTAKKAPARSRPERHSQRHAAISFVARFGDGKGTNPEELIAAAHAGCFTMALSFMLNNAGFTGGRDRHRGRADDGPGRRQAGRSPRSICTTRARVPKIDAAKFAEIAAERQGQLPDFARCSTRTITMDAKLRGPMERRRCA